MHTCQFRVARCSTVQAAVCKTGRAQIGTHTGNPDCGPRQGAFGAILGAARANIAPASASNTHTMTPAAPYVAFTGGECHVEKPRTGLLLNRTTQIYLAPTTQAGSLGVHGGRPVAPGVGGRDLGRPYPPRGGAMWPGLNSAEVRPVLHTSEMVLPPCRDDIDSCGCHFFLRLMSSQVRY